MPKDKLLVDDSEFGHSLRVTSVFAINRFGTCSIVATTMNLHRFYQDTLVDCLNKMIDNEKINDTGKFAARSVLSRIKGETT